MKVTCPACGSCYDLDAALGDADARRFADLVAGLPPAVAKLLIQYLVLFRPGKTGLRWSRMLTLAQELEPMIRAGQITRNGTRYAAPAEAWITAFGALIDRPKTLTLPLKSHGYLLEVIAGAAEKVAGKQEREVEARRQHSPEGQRQGLRSVADMMSQQRAAPPPGWRGPFDKGGGSDDEG